MITRKRIDHICERNKGKFYFVESRTLVEIARETGRSIKRIPLSDGYYYHTIRHKGTTFASKTSVTVGNGVKVMLK